MLKYQCELQINANLKTVSDLYLDKEARFRWEKGLEKIEEISGEFNKTGSKVNLHFEFNESKMVMSETIELNNMPDMIIAIYEVEGVWNRCVNHFYEQDGYVKWVMESEFKFVQEMNVPVSNFKHQTLKGMELFKEFVESEKEA